MIEEVVRQKVEEIEKAIRSGRKVVITKKVVKSVETIDTERSVIVKVDFDDGTTRAFYASDFIHKKVEII